MRSAELAIVQPLGTGTLRLSGRDFATDGFPLVAPEDRGPIDVAAGSRHHWLSARWSQQVGDGLQLAVAARTFAEHRGNGTPFQKNSSRENFGSVQLQSAAGTFSWGSDRLRTGPVILEHLQFGECDAHRRDPREATSSPCRRPHWARRGRALGCKRTAPAPRSVGTCAKSAAKRASILLSSAARSRGCAWRVARRTWADCSLLREQPIATDLRATLGARLDEWRESDGHRRESDLATDIASRDDHYATRDGVELSPSAGLVWQAMPAWRVRAAAQQAFRRPTLNELYRPFRAGSVVTEANVALRTERVMSAELGADYTAHDLTLGAAFFWNELHDAVGNVTLCARAGHVPVVRHARRRRHRPAAAQSRSPAGPRARVVGGMRPAATLTLNASFLYDEAVVRRASVAPALEGKRLAQVPRQSATLGASWHAPGGLGAHAARALARPAVRG